MLVNEIFDAIEILLLPGVWSFATHGLGGEREVGGHSGIAVIEVGEGGVDAIVRNAGKRAFFVAAVGSGKPIEAVGKMLAHSKAQAAFASGIAPGGDDVAFWASCHGVPAGLILGIPHVEVIVMNAHAYKIFGARLYV